MQDFERNFLLEIKNLGLRKKDVAHTLGITYPSLKYKIKDPDRLKVIELRKLKGLGFTLNHLGL